MDESKESVAAMGRGSSNDRETRLALRFAGWSVAMLPLIATGAVLDNAAHAASGASVVTIAGLQAAAVLGIVALTMRCGNGRTLSRGAFGALVWLSAGWVWQAIEVGWLGGLAVVLFAAQVSSGMLLPWTRLWQELVAASAVVAFLVAAFASGVWWTGAIGLLGWVLFGGALGWALLVTLRGGEEHEAIFGQRDRTFMERLVHEIRSPAGAISMRVELLRDQVSDAKTLSALEAIGAAALRILSLTDNLCDAFQIEAGDIRSRPRSVDLNAVVEGTAAELAAAARNRQIQVEMALDPSRPQLDVDPRHLKRVTANLLDNAVKFTPMGGRVTVSTTASSPWVKIAFKDSGPGIDTRQGATLFAPPKLGTKKRRAGGLGLFVAKTMTELCGGTILVESTPGHGATFTVVIPQEGKPAASRQPGGGGN
jgi:signal transduction histidine kinase